MFLVLGILQQIMNIKQTSVMSEFLKHLLIEKYTMKIHNLN